MKKMLIVEDDDLTQKVLSKIFNDDFQIDICESAEEFYQSYSSNRYDIVIMDISLRGNKHGLELTKEIKASAIHGSMPILCLTAHAFPKDKKNAMESGIDAFFTKPVSNEILKQAVASLLKGQRLA
ncbi:MAG: response regulator [Bacteroidetes bacterium]|nr:response regulator [Bacteroidota bacterium]